MFKNKNNKNDLPAKINTWLNSIHKCFENNMYLKHHEKIITKPEEGKVYVSVNTHKSIEDIIAWLKREKDESNTKRANKATFHVRLSLLHRTVYQEIIQRILNLLKIDFKIIKKLHKRMWLQSTISKIGNHRQQAIAKKQIIVINQQRQKVIQSLLNITKILSVIVSKPTSQLVLEEFKAWLDEQNKISFTEQLKSGEYIFWKNKLYYELCEELPSRCFSCFERIKRAFLLKNIYERIKPK